MLMNYLQRSLLNQARTLLYGLQLPVSLQSAETVVLIRRSLPMNLKSVLLFLQQLHHCFGITWSVVDCLVAVTTAFVGWRAPFLTYAISLNV
jgi:hypothetical protein